LCLNQFGLGLTAIELEWLADWLESPEFPRGLHTLSAARQADGPPPARGADSGSTTPPPK
jgi:hypothetical protein